MGIGLQWCMYIDWRSLCVSYLSVTKINSYGVCLEFYIPVYIAVHTY